MQAHRFSCSDTSLNADSVFLSGFGLQFELDHDKIPHAEQAAERAERFAPEVGLPEHKGSAYPQPGIRGLDRYGDRELFPDTMQRTVVSRTIFGSSPWTLREFDPTFGNLMVFIGRAGYAGYQVPPPMLRRFK